MGDGETNILHCAVASISEFNLNFDLFSGLSNAEKIVSCVDEGFL